MDFGEGLGDSALNGLFSFPTVLGHEVVADVVELGPGYDGPEVGTRVVLNPWLSCVPRGIDPICGSCQSGDFSLCWHFTEGDLAPGIHTGTCRDAPGGFADILARSRDDAPPRPRRGPRRARRPGRSVLRVASLRHPAPASARRAGPRVRGRRTRDDRHRHPACPLSRRRSRRRRRSSLPGGACTAASARLSSRTSRSTDLIEEVAAWSGGRLRRAEGALPMAHPGGIDVVYDTIGTATTSEVAVQAPRTARDARKERGQRS